MVKIKCSFCGKDVSYESIDSGKAEHRFFPHSTSYSALTDDFIIIQRQRNEYTCEKCTKERTEALNKMCNWGANG